MEHVAGADSESDRPNSDLTEPLRLEMPERYDRASVALHTPHPQYWFAAGLRKCGTGDPLRLRLSLSSSRNYVKSKASK